MGSYASRLLSCNSTHWADGRLQVALLEMPGWRPSWIARSTVCMQLIPVCRPGALALRKISSNHGRATCPSLVAWSRRPFHFSLPELAASSQGGHTCAQPVVATSAPHCRWRCLLRDAYRALEHDSKLIQGFALVLSALSLSAPAVREVVRKPGAEALTLEQTRTGPWTPLCRSWTWHCQCPSSPN
jgi:hypothetical protein